MPSAARWTKAQIALGKDYAATFATPAGQRVLADLVEYAENRDQRGATTEDTYFKLGEANCVRRIRAYIEAGEAPKKVRRGVDAPARAVTEDDGDGRDDDPDTHADLG